MLMDSAMKKVTKADIVENSKNELDSYDLVKMNLSLVNDGSAVLKSELTKNVVMAKGTVNQAETIINNYFQYNTVITKSI